MSLASSDTLPFEKEKPDLGNAGIAAKLGDAIFALEVVLCVVGAPQQGHPASLSELSQLYGHGACPPTSLPSDQSGQRSSGYQGC